MHIFLIASEVTYKLKNKRTKKETYVCTLAWENEVKISQKAMNDLTKYLTYSFAAQNNIDTKELESFNLLVTSISNLGDMTFEEFADEQDITVRSLADHSINVVSCNDGEHD